VPVIFTFALGLLLPLAMVIYAEELSETGGMLGMGTIPQGTPSKLLATIGFIILLLVAVAGLARCIDHFR